MKVLLFGGNGFLGTGLQDELKTRHIDFQSIDKNNYDLVNYANLNTCILDLKDATHVVILASKLGIDLFNTDPVSASTYNNMIHKFIFDAIQFASKKYNKSYNVTYYSTSETYGSLNSKNEIITLQTPYKFIKGHNRYLYSHIKYNAEVDYFKMNYEHPEIVYAVKIIHPFNVYGKNQKRGVVYSMIKNALENNVITYSNDTTRTLTSLKLASRMSVDVILSDENQHANISDVNCSLTMKSLAQIIKDILGIPQIKLINTEPDKLIRYRHTSIPDANIQLAKDIMQKEVLELAAQIKDELLNEQV